mgnify:CR=1 FL=1
MKFAMFAALTASLMACGPSPADSEATTRISASSQGHHAREVMVDCEDAVWTVHVRTSADVRAVEVLTPDAVSYATLDYPIRDGEGEVVGYGFLAYLPVVDTPEEAVQHIAVGGATSVACDAKALPLTLNLWDDDFQALECVSLDEERVAADCVDYAPFVTRRD